MSLRKTVLLAITVGMIGHVTAQEVTPAQPASAVAPTPASPASPSPSAMPPMNIDGTATAPAETNTKPEPEKSAALDGKLDQEKIMAAQKAGYEVRNENGETLLCRKEAKTGSRLRHNVSCMTPRQWEQLQSDTAQMLRANERRRVGPANN